MIIYKYNLNLILLLLYNRDLKYYIKKYNIYLKKIYLNLNLENIIKKFLKIKKKQFINFLNILI